MKLNKIDIIISCYMLLTIISCFSLDLIESIGFLFGASSALGSFVTMLAFISPIITVLTLVWLFIYPILLITSYAVAVWKKNYWFFVTMCLSNMIVMLLLVVMKLHLDLHTGLASSIWGIVLSLIFCLTLIFFLKKRSHSIPAISNLSSIRDIQEPSEDR